MEKYLINRFLILYLIPFLSGSLTVFSFQPFNLTIINFLILPIFFYLILFIKKKSKSKYRKKPYKKNLFIFGTTFGFGFYLSGIHWITFSLTFDESFKILIPFALILIPLFLSLFFSIITLTLGPFINSNFSSIFLLSIGLAFSDFMRAKILSGFPWNLWAYSFSWTTEILQLLNYIGLFAFNLLCITLFLIPSVFFFKINLSKKILLFLFIPLTLITLYIFGNHNINQNKKIVNIVENKVNIKVISPNFKIDYGISEIEIKERLEKLIRYSDPADNLKTLFVWPEGVFSGYNYSQVEKFKELFSNFKKNHLIVFGINRLNQDKTGTFNSLVIVDNNFEIQKEYKKIKLVPFGEFLPFENFFNKLGFKKITEGQGSFLEGGIQDNLEIKPMNILPLICYEIIFPSLTQKSNVDTNLIINVSEDGWFGKTIGPYQHFSKAIFRAIEQNSYLIRSANKGVSAIINNKGEVIKKLNINETGNIELVVPLIKSDKKNKNDLIFFILLFTYWLFVVIYKKNVKR